MPAAALPKRVPTPAPPAEPTPSSTKSVHPATTAPAEEPAEADSTIGATVGTSLAADTDTDTDAGVDTSVSGEDAASDDAADAPDAPVSTSAPDSTDSPAAADSPAATDSPAAADSPAATDSKPATSKAPRTDKAEPRTPSDSAAAPAVDETFDFKALSFAAIAAAHKKELGPRTVAGETGASEKQKAADPGEDAPAAGPGEVARETEAPAEARPAAPDDAPTEELFAPPATRIPPAVMPPSPFPTPAAPPQHQPGAPRQDEGAGQQPPSPFPSPRGGSAHPFPAVHGYAPEASYAGWRPPTAADDAAKRRRFAMIGGAAVAALALVAVVVLVVNMVSKQQWEPIEAMIAEPREVHPLQLVLGSCVETVPEDGEVSEVLAVPCTAAHTAQVVGRTDFADAAVWPGRDEVDKRVALVCGTKQLGPVARTSQLANSVSYVVWGPSEESWSDGDRVGLCLATTDEPITQDLLQ
ncbi:MAG TPA: septum formation family protein [Streptomyces sp.]|nr:septum formation family protein [Streptomyces sp.]